MKTEGEQAARDRIAAYVAAKSRERERVRFGPSHLPQDVADDVGLTSGPADTKSEPEGFIHAEADASQTSASDVASVIGLTIGPSDDRESRLRALFTLFFHEAGLTPDEATIAALATAARRMGYALVPIRR